MSNTYPPPSSPPPLAGPSLSDLVSTQKGGVQNLGHLVRSFSNVFRSATASTSPVFIGVNNLGTTGTTIMSPTIGLGGLKIHNPATGNVNAYVYSLSIATAPTLSAPGGAILVLPGATEPFPCPEYANFNVGLGAFVSAGTTGALTIIQFF